MASLVASLELIETGWPQIVSVREQTGVELPRFILF